MCFFLQAEDGIRDLVRSRGLGDVYKRQDQQGVALIECAGVRAARNVRVPREHGVKMLQNLRLSLIHI